MKMSVEILMLQEIEKRPCLYNFYLPEYNRKEVLDEAWSEVAANCELTSAECKDKWKNIRSSFVRNIKLNGGKSRKPYYLSHYLQFVVPFLKTGTDISTEDSQVQQTEDSVEYNDQDLPGLASIKLEPNIDLETNSEELELECSSYKSKVPVKVEETPTIQKSNPRNVFLRKKRRIGTMTKINSDTRTRNVNLKRDTSLINYRLENNAMRFFLMSLLPEFETMTDDQVRMFKIKVMMLIDDIKTQNTSKEDFKLDSERLQKRLINLLLKNLEQKT